jgi:CubicO group peptidase (beta-lactamase class C family)
MIRLLISLLLIVPCLPTIAQQFAVSPDKIKSLDSLFRSQYPATDPGVVVIAAKDGKPFYRKAFGMANLELQVPLGADHKLGIGSISKQFAAVSILLLQQDGKLSIKDDIRKYLPAYNTYGKTITIEHILSHTSGIPSYTELFGFDTIVNRTISNHQLVKFFESRPLLFEPGSNWSYSNSGYVLAAIIVEKVSGMPFNDFLQQRIFRPLMMNETILGSSDFIAPGKTGEYSGPTPKGRVKMETQYNWYWAYGAGQIISTVDDMLKWDDGLYNHAFLRADLRDIAHKTFVLKDGSPANYGLGWAIDGFGNKTMVRHGGAIGGYRAEGMRIPEDHVYVLVLSNTATTNSSLLSNRILSILYDKPALKEVKDGQQNWKEIEGVYESLNAGLRLQSNFGSKPAFLTIRVDSTNRVTAQRTGGAPFSLSPAGKDLLFDKSNPFTALKIERNAGGTVEGFRVQYHFPGTGPERYNKRISSTVPPMRIPEKTDSATLAKYAGWYENAFGDRVRLVIGNNQLFMEQPPVNTRTALLWIRGNTFWVKETDMEVNFDADSRGRITGMRFFSGFYDNVLRKIEEIY